MLETRNVEIYYGKIMVVRGLSLTVEEGQIRAILGANGAGKSTILKAIMGYLDDQPEKGSIWFKGKRIDGMHTNTLCAWDCVCAKGGRCPELTLGEPYDGRAPDETERSPKTWIACSCIFLCSTTSQTTGRDSIRRRAADAGHCEGVDVQTELDDP
jgi:ABC-type dipeptide/oligopeptide/nickel transport system ATPase component